MAHRSLSVLALAVAASLVGGCSAGASSEPSDELAEGALARADGSHAYRFDHADIGTWIFRVDSKAGKLSGHFDWPVPANTRPLGRGTVVGTVASSGKQTMTWTMPGTGLGPIVPIVFEGAQVNGRLEGTWTVQGEASKPAVLEEIKPGTLDQGRPLTVAFESRKVSGPCTAEASGFEVFGLNDSSVEQSINAKVDGAIAKIAGGCSGATTFVTGGAVLGVVRPDLISFSIDQLTDDGTNASWSIGERVTMLLDTGAPLALFGDVLQPGQDAALATELDHAIDAIDSYSIDAAGKAKMKALMLAPAYKQKLPKVFSLNERGVNFGAEGFDGVRVHGVTIPYTALAAILAPNGKAKSAWNP